MSHKNTPYIILKYKYWISLISDMDNSIYQEIMQLIHNKFINNIILLCKYFNIKSSVIFCDSNCIGLYISVTIL